MFPESEPVGKRNEVRRCSDNEKRYDDFPAAQRAEVQSPWFPCKNGDQGRKKSSCGKKSQGQSEINGLIGSYVENNERLSDDDLSF